MKATRNVGGGAVKLRNSARTTVIKHAETGNDNLRPVIDLFQPNDRVSIPYLVLNPGEQFWKKKVSLDLKKAKMVLACVDVIRKFVATEGESIA